MRKDAIAESILRLVTTRERAASTVGDFMERRGVPFWWSVLRTATALTWQGMTAEPGQIWGLAFRGFLMSWAIIGISLLGWIVVVSACAIVYRLLGLPAHGLGIGTANMGFPSLCLTVAWVVVLLLGQFQTGRWVARRAPGRELSACVATILSILAFDSCINIVTAVATHQNPVLVLVAGGAAVVIFQSPCFLGAIVVRRRATSA
jgi:hypothetical protein